MSGKERGEAGEPCATQKKRTAAPSQLILSQLATTLNKAPFTSFRSAFVKDNGDIFQGIVGIKSSSLQELKHPETAVEGIVTGT